jgi:Rieske Fe-S protein
MAKDHSRREFLATLAGGTAAVAASTCLLGQGCGVNPAPGVKVGAVDAAGQVKITPANIAALAYVGGAAQLTSAGVGIPIFIVRSGDNEYNATSGLCTHVQCPVGYNSDLKLIECPCHAARFTLDGKVVRLPATAPLTKFPTRVDKVSGELIIDTNGDEVPALVGSTVTLTTDDFAELDTVGGSRAFTPTGLDDPILLVRPAQNTVLTFDAYSTAQRCVLDYVADRAVLSDPCTGSEFALDGTVRKGPATKPVKQYATTFDGTTITITIK